MAGAKDMSDLDPNPFTEQQRRATQRIHRGKALGPFRWRGFCMVCGIPMVVYSEALRYERKLRCFDCREKPKTT